MHESEKILNQVASMVATNQDRKWTRTIEVRQPSEVGGEVSVTEKTVQISTSLFTEDPDLIFSLVELAFEKSEEFDSRQQKIRNEYIAQYTEGCVENFHRLLRRDRAQARDVLEMLREDYLKENGRH